jgi:DnaK suppressor protein
MTASTDNAAIKTPRTDLDLDAYKARLLELKASSEATLASMAVEDEEGLNTTGTDRAELSSADNHPADLGTELQLREQDQALMENERNILHQVTRALESIEAGTYGYSERSGKPIPKERLDAQPYATLTVDEQDF